MNAISEEIFGYLDSASMTDEEFLEHYGMPRRSGRYPWGSGKDPHQHNQDFLSRVAELKKQGWTETADNIKKAFGDDVTLDDYRNEKSWCNYERRMLLVNKAKSLKADGKGATEIGRELGLTESTVRSLLDPHSEERMKVAAETANFLKKQCDEKGMIDVGAGVEIELGVTRTRLDQALYKLKGDGYEVYGSRFDQVTNANQKTTQQVLCPPGTKHNEIYNLDQIHTINDYRAVDGGESFRRKFTYPESLDSKRLMVRYKEDGGIDKDGIVELRPGKDDLSLGESRYSQVRIMVDGKKYIKGMAVYGDPKDFPDGVDVIFNTNKTKNVAKMDVLKDVKDDPENPFGSLIKDANQGGQYWYKGKDGKDHLGLINKRADQGDWDEWKDALPSQFLAKQSLSMAKKQLGLAKADKQAEFDEIMSLTNPTVKKYWLNKFADGCDSAAVHLKAAALPGQKYHVIIPINTLKDNEVYAPNYKDGTKLALIRYPHGGTFEIPILTVNNKNLLGNKIIGKESIDGIGINHKIADRLSGADFDGDTVMAIPTHDRAGKVKITSTPPLKGLEGFDPKVEYHESPGMKYMKDPKTGKDNTQKEMGVISNLITDMTLGGASQDELAAAVRHSMVVIDAGKHKLNYKQSEIDNNIAALKKKYQIKEIDADGNVVKSGGASTLLSRSKGEKSVDKRQGSPKVNIKGTKDYDPTKPEGSKLWKTADDLYYPVRKKNKDTGEIELRTIDGKKVTYDPKDKKAYEEYTPVKQVDPKTGDVTYTNKGGDIVYKLAKRTQASTRMAETDDANTLVSTYKHPMELLYADYANSMKSLANRARVEMVNTGKIEYSKTAKTLYTNEVKSLTAKLNDAELNRVRERTAQRKANVDLQSKMAADPTMSKADAKKAGQKALSKYREEVGSVARRDRSIKISDKEWEAIQAGAVSENTLKRILNNADADNLRQRSMPKTTSAVSSAQVTRIKAMSSTYTIGQIAEKLGLSTSTVSKYLKGAN